MRSATGGSRLAAHVSQPAQKFVGDVHRKNVGSSTMQAMQKWKSDFVGYSLVGTEFPP